MSIDRRPLEPARLAQAKRAFTTRRVALDRARLLLTGGTRPMAGDLLLCRVVEPGQHKALQLASGRPSTLFPGDELLLAAGNRYAPDQFEAYLPDGTGPCHLVAAGGLGGRVESRFERMGEPTRLEALGLVADASGRPLNLADFRIHPPRALRRIPTIAVLGTSMNAGKTTAAAHLVRGLVLSGVVVGAAKVTGTSAPGDLTLVLDAGAATALDFTDVGHASTFLLDEPALEETFTALIDALVAAGAEVAVLEVADGLYQRETAMLAASVVGLFEGTIARFAMLAALMGIVSGMGGNAGTQTLAVVVRAMATNQLTSSNTVRMILRELRIATANGATLGLLIGGGTALMFGNPLLGLVIGSAMVINNLVAGLAGIMVPVTLDRLKVDPAVSSAVFVTMATDVMGFFSFLGLAVLSGLAS